MNEIDNFISFLFSNIDNENVNITKKMKYGFQFFYLNVLLENDKPSEYNYASYDDLSIIIDNRNKCIEICSGAYNAIIIEDLDLVNKWSEIFNNFYNSTLNRDIENLINDTFINTKQKDLLRDYKLKKINI